MIKCALPHQTSQDQEVRSECEEGAFWSNYRPRGGGETPGKVFFVKGTLWETCGIGLSLQNVVHVDPGDE